MGAHPGAAAGLHQEREGDAAGGHQERHHLEHPGDGEGLVVQIALKALVVEHFDAELRLVISQRCRDEVPEALKLRIYEALRRAGGS